MPDPDARPELPAYCLRIVLDPTNDRARLGRLEVNHHIDVDAHTTADLLAFITDTGPVLLDSLTNLVRRHAEAEWAKDQLEEADAMPRSSDYTQEEMEGWIQQIRERGGHP